MSKKAIVFAANGDYSFCLYVSILSFIKNSSQFYKNSDVFIYVSDIKKKDAEILSQISDNIKVMKYSFPLKLKITPSVIKFSIVSFARYECFSLLDKYEKVLYLDSDILVQKELYTLFDKLNVGFGMIPEKTTTNFFYPYVKEYDRSSVQFNSGIIVLKRKLANVVNLNKLKEFCYSKTVEYIDYLALPDQGIINLACQKFNINPDKISMLYNMPASLSRKELNKAYIIHSTGHRKFWNYYYFNEWYKYYSEWISKGGSPSYGARKIENTIYYKFCKRFGLDKKVFFQLCPDIFRQPVKALRFLIKRLFRIKY